MNTFSKYLTPYRIDNIGIGEESYIRNYLGSNTHGFSVWKNRFGGSCSYVNSNLRIKEASSLHDAKKWLDEDLIKNGYILLTEEQFEKYSLLC